MFNVEEFIECVKDNRPIWDKESKGYLDKGLKEQCWMRIGERMLHGWEQQKHSERLKRVQDLKNKWRHIRDSYTKYLHQKNPKRKKYVYADNLSFLNDAVGQRQRLSEYEVGAEDAENSSHDGLSNKRRYSTILKTATAQSAQSVKNSPQSSLGKLDDNYEEDADKAFLLSVLPDLKKLNDDEKLDFRIHTLQFFRDVRRKKRNFQSTSFEYAICQSPLDVKSSDTIDTYQEQSDCSPRTATPLSCPVSPSFSHQSTSSE